MTTTQQQNDFAQIHSIFQPPSNRYDLNLPAIRLLIEWAEGDEALAAYFGTWDQQVWNEIKVSMSALQEAGLDGEDEPVTEEFVAEATRNGVCNTAYCMAGQAVVQAGYRLAYTSDDEGSTSPALGAYEVLSADYCERRVLLGYDANGRPRWEETGERVYIANAGARILGLDSDEQGSFFDGDNGIEDLKFFVNKMCERRGLPLEYPGVDESPRDFEADNWDSMVGGD